MPENFRLEVNYTQQDIQMMTVLHYADRGGGDAPDLASGWYDQVDQDLLAVLHSSLTVNNIRVVNVTTKLESTYTVEAAGLLGGEALPPTCTYLIRLLTDFADRSRKGRIYLPGVNEGWNVGGIISQAGLTALGTLATGLQTIATSQENYDLQIFSRTKNIFTPVASLAVSQYVRTQRRRGFGRGS